MARQINFFHLESDIAPLLQFIEHAGGLVYLNGEYHRPTEVCPQIIANMSTWVFQYFIVPSVLLPMEIGPRSSTGMAIELCNCTKGTPNATEYREGRFYLCSTRENEYVPELDRLYSQMAAYIKKRYRYSKACSVYFSPEFLEKSISGQVTPRGPGRLIYQFDRVVMPTLSDHT